MLENKKVNMVLSLIIAIALWAFVIGEVNPEATRVYREVPIQLINQEALDRAGLAIYSVSETSMAVTLTGTRSEINQVTAKDITATVDLEQAALGENSLKIDIRVPSKVEIEGQSINKLTVVIEEETSKEVDIQVIYKGAFTGEAEPITIEQSLYSVMVTGAESKVARVARIDAIVEENTVTTEEQTFECDLVPVDGQGVQVSNVLLETGVIEVTAELAKTRSVSLEVPVLESENKEIRRTVKTPETIIIKGRASDLESIDVITAEPLSLDSIFESTTIPIVPILPEAVEVSEENLNLEAVVQVEKLQSGTFTFDAKSVSFNNMEEGLEANAAAGKVEVTVTGTQNLLQQITENNFTLSVDLAGLKAGTHRVPLIVQCDNEMLHIEYKPQELKVIIKESEEGDTSTDENEADDAQDAAVEK